jgi:hypothetical protein
MASHSEELINFLDEHWCNAMFAHDVRDPFGPNPEESLKRLNV